MSLVRGACTTLSDCGWQPDRVNRRQTEHLGLGTLGTAVNLKARGSDR